MQSELPRIAATQAIVQEHTAGISATPILTPMNNEQTKTPGEVAHNAYWSGTPAESEWGHSKKLMDHWERTASAVISHVLGGAKWVMLEPEDVHVNGDEYYSADEEWKKIGKEHVGHLVGEGVPCRRLIPLPSSVRPEGTPIGGLAELYQGKPQGPSTTPPASSGAAGADVPAAWQLPPPPAGMKWHRADGWTQDMLPEGWRPLLRGEYATIDEDEFASYPNGVWLTVQATGPSVPGQLHTRTNRPLPQSAEPVVEEKPAKWTYGAYRASLLKDGKLFALMTPDGNVALSKGQAKEIVDLLNAGEGCDQLRKELESAKQDLYETNESYEKAAHDRDAAARDCRRVTTENTALKVARNNWEFQYQDRVAALRKLQEMYDGIAKELTRLRSQFRWIPVPLEGITRTDERNKLVIWVSDSTSESGLEWLHGISRRATHYIPIESLRQFLPLPSPETEEQAMRREFEEWALSGHANEFDLRKDSTGAYTLSDTAIAWLAYQAAKQSTKEKA